MSIHRIILLCSAAFAAAVLLVQGQNATDAVRSQTGLTVAKGQLQVEFSRTGRKPEVSVSVMSVPQPAETTAPLTLTLRAIVGSDEAEVDDRLTAVDTLGADLNCHEIAVLCVFLKQPLNPQAKRLRSLHALKNNILNVLREQTAPPPGLTGLMVEMYHDRAQDPVMRDYAIQHLGAWYNRDDAVSPKERERIRAVLAEAVRELNSTAGTALLGMHRLSADDEAFDATQIDCVALSLVQSADTDTAARLTAIQVCAERGLKEALPTVETLAQTSDCIPMQLSAIAAAARLGGSQQAKVLRSIGPTPNEEVNAALQVALRQLEQSRDLF
jgi:hypothetical protein